MLKKPDSERISKVGFRAKRRKRYHHFKFPNIRYRKSGREEEETNRKTKTTQKTQPNTKAIPRPNPKLQHTTLQDKQIRKQKSIYFPAMPQIRTQSVPGVWYMLQIMTAAKHQHRSGLVPVQVTEAH